MADGESPADAAGRVAGAYLRAMDAMEPHRVRLFTAHQMGGCGMGRSPEESVVNGFGEHHHVANLSVHDASIFPTSIGANPQLSVYALAARNSTRLAQKVKV